MKSLPWPRDPNYIIYEDGRIWSSYRKRYLTPFRYPAGYQNVTLQSKSHRVHRVVAETFLSSNDPEKNVVDHIDGNPTNNHFTNLQWVTLSENSRKSKRENGVGWRKVKEVNLLGDVVKIHFSIRRCAKDIEMSHVTLRRLLYQEKEVNTSRGTIVSLYTFSPPVKRERVLSLPHDAKNVPGFMCACTPSGEVYSTRTNRRLRPCKVDFYLQLPVHTELGRRIPQFVHRLVCMAFHGEHSSEKAVVDHLNGNKHDNRPENLEWVSHSENVRRYLARKSQI